jgi:tetratricopeptide (TPR) repeat protein
MMRLKAFVLLNEKKFDAAITEYSKAIALHPAAPFLYSSRGRAYRLKRDNINAIADFTKALEIEPNAFEVYFERGALWAAGMQFDKAIDDYTKAIAKSPINRDRNLFYSKGRTAPPFPYSFHLIMIMMILGGT